MCDDSEFLPSCNNFWILDCLYSSMGKRWKKWKCKSLLLFYCQHSQCLKTLALFMPGVISFLLAQKSVMIQQRVEWKKREGESEREVDMWKSHCTHTLECEIWTWLKHICHWKIISPPECSPRVVMVTEFHVGTKPKVLAAEPYVAWLFSKWSHCQYLKCISLRGVLSWNKCLILTLQNVFVSKWNKAKERVQKKTA